MRKTLTVGALALLVSGCMLGPDYFRPAVDTPPAWRVNDQEAHTAIDAAWWRQFGDPQLDALVDEALSANLDLLIASERIAEYAGRLGVARSDLFPQVGAGYDVARQRNTYTLLAMGPTTTLWISAAVSFHRSVLMAAVCRLRPPSGRGDVPAGGGGMAGTSPDGQAPLEAPATI